MENKISYITNVHELQKYLKIEMFQLFKTNFFELRIFTTVDSKTEIQKYFENNLTDRIFINDVVFIEEKKNKFNKEAFLGDLPEKAFLVLPIFDSDGNTNI